MSCGYTSSQLSPPPLMRRRACQHWCLSTLVLVNIGACQHWRFATMTATLTTFAFVVSAICQHALVAVGCQVKKLSDAPEVHDVASTRADLNAASSRSPSLAASLFSCSFRCSSALVLRSPGRAHAVSRDEHRYLHYQAPFFLEDYACRPRAASHRLSHHRLY